MPNNSGPLTGLKVLDLSVIVAGGAASSLLADFGAQVVKVEQPGAGDPLRNWGPFANGVSLWWKVHSRNKQSITLNLAHPDGQAVLKELAGQADLLIEGFRPGVMERWNIGPEDLHRKNPGLVIIRVSGFGQTGPYRERPGFGTIAECMSGFVGMTGFPDSPPVLPPVPLADEVAGIFAAMSGMMALYHRDAGVGRDAGVMPDVLHSEDAQGAPPQSPADAPARGRGQVIDVSLFEPLFRLCIPHVTIYQQLGISRQRAGNAFPDAAPRNLYQSSDGRWMGLSATSQGTFENLAKAMGMDGLLQDPRFQDNASRLENNPALDAVIQDWLGQHSSQEIMEQLVPAGGVVGPVYDAGQIAEDPHYLAREDIVEIDDPDLGPMQMLGIVPKFSETPGVVEHAGPSLGEHNVQIYGEWLGYGAEELARLADLGVI